MSVSEAITTESPFAGLSMSPDPERDERTSPAIDRLTLESPFGEAVAVGMGEAQHGLTAQLVHDLEDEDFTDTLEMLADEAAARHLADYGRWSATPAEATIMGSLEAWIEPLAQAAEGAIDGFAAGLANVDVLGMPERDFSQLTESLTEAPALGPPVFEDFLTGLMRKARKLVSGAVRLAKKGAAAVGRIIPIGLLLDKLKSLIRPLLASVLRSAVNRLPRSVQPLARTLAARFGLGETLGGPDVDPEALAENFDADVAALAFAADVVPEAETATHADERDADRLSELDDARVRLATRLTEVPPDVPPVGEIEQFVQTVLAARPLIKLGIDLIGREKVGHFIADRVADLIKGLIGEQAARTLAPPLVDVGLRAIGFEVRPDESTTLAGEALASTVEGTVERVLELPAEALVDQLQLDAAVQQAFAEAAAAYLPDTLLRADLPERETAGEGGVWILLPRATRPCHRFRKYTKVFAVPISRQLARAIAWSDGGTLETHLLDRGVRKWPVVATVDLFEAMPGTQFGHLTQDETVPEPERAYSTEFQPLTVQTAGLLLGEPGLGRGPARRRPVSGARYFRVRPVGLEPARYPHRRRMLVGLDDAGLLRITVRLSERQGQQLLERLDRGSAPARPDLPTVLATLRRTLSGLPSQLIPRLSARRLADDPAVAAERLVAAAVAGLSAFLTANPTRLADAVRDPADGVTITLTIPGLTKEKLAATVPPAQVMVRPGRHGA